MDVVRQIVQRNRFVAYGVPFVLLLVAGSFGLQQFAQLRYAFRSKKLLTREEAELLEKTMKRGAEAATLEKEYAKIRQLDIDHWNNVRGTRPWELNDSRSSATSTTAETKAAA
jgi:cytochrome c oxidase assembly protein subunit 16